MTRLRATLIVVLAGGILQDGPTQQGTGPAGSTLVEGPRAVDSGISWSVFQRGDPLVFHVVQIDLGTDGLDVFAVTGHEDLARRELVSGMAQRHTRGGRRVALATNGDLGGAGMSPSAMFVREGALWVSPSQRSVLAVSEERVPWIGHIESELRLRGPEGAVLQVESVGRADLPGEGVALFPPEWGTTPEREIDVVEAFFEPRAPGLPVVGELGLSVREVRRNQGGTEIPPGRFVIQMRAGAGRGPFRLGHVWRFTATALPDLSPWRTVVGGIPRIVHESKVDVRDEGARESFVTERHPRTAVGYTEDRARLFLVVVDGRRPGHSIGVTLAQLAAIMADLGCAEALNLDGGGSSTLYVDGEVRNQPSDETGERAVTSAVLVTLPDG